ncbi:MAG: moderate conductance mechanosensitive channel [Anaerophaga sp.]|nr:moderate conductance mechanosensitive channel [Anaerophaga sp.]
MKNLLSTEFWSRALSKAIDWAITDLPGIIIMIIALIIFLRVLKFSIYRFRRILVKRAEKDEKVENSEEVVGNE